MQSVFTPDPDFELITFEEAAKQLRVYEGKDNEGNVIISVPDEKSIIESYILAAQGAAEAYLERDIEQGTLVIIGAAFAEKVWFDAWQKVAGVSVSILPFGETERVSLGVDYFSKGKGYVSFASDIVGDTFFLADASDAVIITIEVTVPASIKQACLMKLASFYEYREDRPDKGQGIFETLLRPYRKYC